MRPQLPTAGMLSGKCDFYNRSYKNNRAAIYTKFCIQGKAQNVKVGGDGGDGFLVACEDLGRMFNHSFPACAFFFFFFFQVEISSLTLIPLFRPESVHSGSKSSDDFCRVFPVVKVRTVPQNTFRGKGGGAR